LRNSNSCWQLFALVLLLIAPALGQNVVDHNLNGWGMYFGDHPIGQSRWGAHLEGQWRRHDAFNRWQQLLLRPGVNYEVSKLLLLTGGYAFINSYRYGDYPTLAKATPEHRIWEQALLRYKTRKVSWTTRLRFENRFIGVRDAAGNLNNYRYENRFRAWQRATVPLSRKYYLTGYDEIWFYVKPYVSASALDQNRAYVALGRRFGPAWEFEAGYMLQSIWQRNGRVVEANHTLMFTVVSRQPFRRSSKQSKN
jgi:hypothetical protein